MIEKPQAKHPRKPAAGSGTRIESWLLVGLAAFLQACSHSPAKILPQPDRAQTSDMTPRQEPLCKKGNPESYEVFGVRYHPMKSGIGYRERGTASWYGPTFHGRNTSCGTVYNMYEMTAAHKLLPIPTYVAVTNLDNGRKVIVKVNDRGPFHGDRVIDLSYAAALKLGIVQQGTGRVEVEALDASAPLPADETQTAQTRTDAATVPSATTATVFNAGSSAHGPAPVNTHLTTLAADRLAGEVQEIPPERNPLEATQRFDEQPERGPQLALRASDRGVQILPATASTPVALPVSQPLPPPDAVSQGQFLQVGAFAERQNAERLKAQLTAVVQEKIAIQRGLDGKGGLYRVHIGPLSEASTGRVRATLMRLALPSQLIVN